MTSIELFVCNKNTIIWWEKSFYKFSAYNKIMVLDDVMTYK